MSIPARQHRWGCDAGNQLTEKRKKADPEFDIPDITTKAAPTTVIEKYVTEEEGKITDKYGAPPPPPEEPCPAHLGRAVPPPPPRTNRGAPSFIGAVNAVPAPKTVPLKIAPPNFLGNNTVRLPAPTWKPLPPAHLWRAPATITTTATASWTSWTPPAPVPPRHVYWASPEPPLPDEHC